MSEMRNDIPKVAELARQLREIQDSGSPWFNVDMRSGDLPQIHVEGETLAAISTKSKWA